ncbi:hypothetical protein ABPG74_016922 [Tetrahymena malaccensis]
MNKTITTTLILLTVFSCFVYSDSQCDSHLAYQNVKTLLQEISQVSNQSAQDEISNFFTYFSSQSPQDVSESVLDICAQNNNYQDHQSCCDTQVVQFLDNAPLYMANFLLSQRNVVQKLLNNIANQMNQFPCSPQDSKDKPQSFDDLAQNTNLPLLQDLIQKSQKCQVQYATQIIKLIRGTLCTVCIGVDQLSDFFDSDSKLYVTSSSVSEFQDAINSSINCFSDLVSWSNSGSQESFSQIVNEIISHYIESTCQDRMLGYFQNLVKHHVSSSQNYCTLEQIFSTQNGCLNSQDLIFQDQNSSNRLLQSSGKSNDFAVSQKNGSNVFIGSKKDSIVCQNEHGTCNVSITFQGIYQFYLGFLLILLLILF